MPTPYRSLARAMGSLSIVTLVLLSTAATVCSAGNSTSTLTITGPATVLDSIYFNVAFQVQAPFTPEQPYIPITVQVEVKHGDAVLFSGPLDVDDKNLVTVTKLVVTGHGAAELAVRLVGTPWSGSMEVYVVPGFLSLLPSLFVVFLAIVFRQVIIALGAGVWLGSLFLHRYNPFIGALRALDTVIIGAMTSEDHARIIWFCLILGGTIGTLTKGGGAAGMAEFVTKFARTPMTVQLSTWVMGLVVFFDDYANALITGSTMRPITDKMLISREKLAFIVDSCAATISSLAVVSSWIGVEVAYMSTQFKQLNIPREPYTTFLRTIPWRFYPVMMLFFVLATILLRRDFGPMLAAERRARATGQVIAVGATAASNFEDSDIMPVPGRPKRAINAILPIVLVITAIFTGLYYDGYTKAPDGDFAAIIGSSDPFKALIWASMLGSFTSISMVVVQRILTVSEAMEAWVAGAKSMVFAVIILLHAWSLGNICVELHTAEYIVSGLAGGFNPGFLPLIVFIVSATIAFSTGSSWGCMGIVFPLVLPLADALAPGSDRVMLGSISSILAGAVWGDHCSPISDSCIMSSMATSCDHRAHVKTQLVYACVVAGVAMVCGSLPCGLGWYNEYVGQLIGCGVLLVILLVFGKRTDRIELETLLEGARDPSSTGDAYEPLLGPDDVVVEDVSSAAGRDHEMRQRKRSV